MEEVKLRKNNSRKKFKCPTFIKNKIDKISEAKEKKHEPDDNDNHKMDFDKPVDKNEDDKYVEEDSKNEIIMKPAKNENNDKKNKKKKTKSEVKEEELKESPTEAQNKKKIKKKGKAKKRMTSEVARVLMDTTQIIKNDVKSKTCGKSKDKSKVEKTEKKQKIDNPKQYVYDYMKSQNRPFSLLNIYYNLNGAITKYKLQKILDSLWVEGSLIMKEYQTKIYLFNQDKLDKKITEADIEKIQKEINEKIEENKQLNEEIASKKNELEILTSPLSDEEIKTKIKELKNELSKMKMKVDAIGRKDLIQPEKNKKAEEDFKEGLKKYKKTKKICLDIVNEGIKH